MVRSDSTKVNKWVETETERVDELMPIKGHPSFCEWIDYPKSSRSFCHAIEWATNYWNQHKKPYVWRK
ncbi:MAG: hypothetical protein AAFQ07_06110, partial [Chloroflexota bacterium]